MMSESVVELGLSAKGLGNLHENVLEKDLTFIVGSDRWKCPFLKHSALLAIEFCRNRGFVVSVTEFSIS
jgi:hypothetical protein